MKTSQPFVEEKEAIEKPKRAKSIVSPLLLITGVLAITYSKFWEPFYRNPDLNPAEIAAAEQEAEEIMNRHEDWVQYALIANSTRSRPCLRCPDGVQMVTVKAGEVYKYGITTQNNNRYTKELLRTLDLRFVKQDEGSYTKCKSSEINKIVAYKFLPESVKPEVKLIRPPGNAYRS